MLSFVNKVGGIVTLAQGSDGVEHSDSPSNPVNVYGIKIDGFALGVNAGITNVTIFPYKGSKFI